jgi:cation transport regulator ChaC
VANSSLWIFGYGSLVWRPAFPHRRRAPAMISGWVRRFWQGSTDHRGEPSRPGRVVTLLPTDDPAVAGDDALTHPASPCWGTAYEVAEEDRAEALATLDHRERGGYQRFEVEISLGLEGARRHACPGLVYIATPENENYLGPAPIDRIAGQIAGARGPSGANPEYVFELARALRDMGTRDEHVFAVESALAALGGADDRDAPSPSSALCAWGR